MADIKGHTAVAGGGILAGVASTVAAVAGALPHADTPDGIIAGIGLIAVAVVSHGLFSAATATKVTRFVNEVEPDVKAAVDGLSASIPAVNDAISKVEARVAALETKPAVQAIDPEVVKALAALSAATGKDLSAAANLPSTPAA